SPSTSATCGRPTRRCSPAAPSRCARSAGRRAAASPKRSPTSGSGAASRWRWRRSVETAGAAMKVLVTGGNGFLGRAIVARLAKDHSLTLLVRPTASRDGFPGGVAFASGDVTDRMSVVAAAQGHDAIVHAAALVKLVAKAAEFDRVNVAGFENVLWAAAEAGVSRLVYVSSFIALGPTEGGPGGELDET